MSAESLSKESTTDELSLLPPHSYGKQAPLARQGEPAPLNPGATPVLSRAHRRRVLPRLPTVLASLLILAGLLVLADAGVTLVWQEPISALYAQLKQESLGGDLQALEHEKPTVKTQHTLGRLHEERRRISYLATALERHAKAGSAVGRIHIPTIGASFVVVKGTGTSELENGPGIYSETNFPGVPGTTAIAGHRTTYLAPFRHIDKLRRGQSIVLDMPYARFTYKVIDSRVVLPTDVSVIKPVGYSRLVLSACTPLFSASHRLIVFARLRATVPLGAARLPSAPAGSHVLDEPGGLPPVLKANQRLLPPLVS
jgi:sortase A